MASMSNYSLGEVLAASQLHPFYSDSQYPPNEQALRESRQRAATQDAEANLRKQPLLIKNDLCAAHPC